MISTSGKALDWFREISGYKQESYEQFFEEIAAVPPGARKLLFLPYLTGERAPLWNPLARGSFIGLSLHHSRQEMGRAVAESIGYAIRQIIDRFTTLDLHVTELRLSGQQARNRTYNQLKADITGLPLLVPALPDSELVGDACLGLVAEGVYPSVEEAVGHCVRIDSIIEPNPAFQNRYAEMSQLFKQSYLSLKEIFDKLDSVDKNINSDKNIKL
jgi:xylulokinase